jgi:isoquinoline 1-oxidoreductase beta subunit
MTPSSMDRRAFLRTSALAGGGLLLSLGYVPDVLADAMSESSLPAADFVPSAFIRIEPTGIITLVARNPEAGQGMKTAIPMLIAEELEVDLADVRIELAPGDSATYGRQFLGGSSATGSNWLEMRRVGAAARLMLTTAAAQTWNVPESECVAKGGRITHTPSGRSLAYGALASRAATVPPPALATVPLKDPSRFTLIGTRVTNVDAPAIVTGKPLFGIDVKVPGMKYAVYTKCPVWPSWPTPGGSHATRRRSSRWSGPKAPVRHTAARTSRSAPLSWRRSRGWCRSCRMVMPTGRCAPPRRRWKRRTATRSCTTPRSSP